MTLEFTLLAISLLLGGPIAFAASVGPISKMLRREIHQFTCSRCDSECFSSKEPTKLKVYGTQSTGLICKECVRALK